MLGLRKFALVALMVFLASATARAEDTQAASACPAPPADLDIGLAEQQDWNDCEKWIWACLVQGREANLFERQCMIVRSGPAREAYARHRLAPYLDPGRFRQSNAVGSAFINDILQKPAYSRRLTANGVRIIGAYFERQLSLENLTTDRNIVIDQAIMMAGTRLTNFKTDKNISFDGSNIRGSMLMNRANIAGSLFLENGVYDRIDLRDGRIGASIDASGSFFIGTVRLDRARIDGKVNFVNARLTEVSAWDLSTGGSLWLRRADIRGRIDLTGARIGGDLRMQKVTFGRRLEKGPLSCDWDLGKAEKLFITPLMTPGDDNAAKREAILKEILHERPQPKDSGDMCVATTPEEAATAGVLPAKERKRHEVRLRDMTIGGTLCLVDLTGRYAQETKYPAVARQAEGATRISETSLGVDAKQSTRVQGIESISIDGTQARSTLFRWQEDPSPTLWRAVQFKTGNMVIDLGGQPRRHFIDNLEIGNLSFITSSPTDDPEIWDEDFYPYLCDMRPGSPGPAGTKGTDETTSTYEAHRRIVEFFDSERNEARSVQPFAKIVDKLVESGAASLYLKMELGDFRSRKTCSASAFYRHFDQARWENEKRLIPSVERAWRQTREEIRTRPSHHWLDEIKNIVLDGGCRGAFKAYKYTASYGHQPHNVFIVIAIFVLLFRVLLLFDTKPRSESDATANALGMLYAIDMFVPFIKLDPAHTEMRPRRRALRGYLIFHRVIGLILTSLLALGFYVQRH